MDTRRMKRLFSAASMASMLMASAPAALSHGGAGPGYGMGGAGAGAMMGPGMSGRGMMGPGTMGPGMAGPGMMEPGTMSPGYGMHRAWMGHGADLTAEQRETIDGIRSDLRREQWSALGTMLDARDTLYELLSADEPDPRQVGAAFENLSRLQRQMLEAHVAAHNRMLGVLTDEQRAELGEWQHGAMHRWAFGGHGYGIGHGMMMPGM